MSDKIPVTVLTGFLGSGKTTLLNRILHESHGQRIAIIENEFGEIGVDQDLVINADEEIFEMNNGCICCTVRGDLIRILGNLAKRKDRFDRVLLETTGLADPGPVAQTFFADEEIRDEYVLDGVITLVDSRHILQHLDDSDEAVAQIAFADRILLNKTDLVSTPELNEVRSRVHRINNMATSLPVVMAAAPLAEVLDVGGFDLDRALESRPGFLEPEYPFEWAGLYRLEHGLYTVVCSNGPDPAMSVMLVPVRHEQGEQLLTAAESIFRHFSGAGRIVNSGGQMNIGEHLVLNLNEADKYVFNVGLVSSGYYALFTQHTPGEFDLSLNNLRGITQKPLHEHYFNAAHNHDDTVSSISLEFKGSLDEELFMRWLNILIRSQGANIFRTKGILSFSGEPNRYVLQGVHMLMESKPGKPWDHESRLCRLVFIGRNLDRDFLQGVFEACKA